MVNEVLCRQVRGYFCNKEETPNSLYPYYIHGHQLKHVDHVKYLGVNITSDLLYKSSPKAYNCKISPASLELNYALYFWQLMLFAGHS